MNRQHSPNPRGGSSLYAMALMLIFAGSSFAGVREGDWYLNFEMAERELRPEAEAGNPDEIVIDALKDGRLQLKPFNFE